MSNYWIGDSIGRVLGPLTLQSLRALISSGRLKAVTRASRDGEHWEPITQFSEVRDLLSAAAAVHPPENARAQAERLRQQLRQMQPLTAWQLFGVKPDAPLEELRGAFFRAARRFSPEHLSADTPAELRQANSDIFELLARRMREAEGPRPPAPNTLRAAPAMRVATPPPFRAAAAQTPAYTYSAEEFVGLQTRNERLQVEVRVSGRNTGIFTDHRIINLQSGGLFLPTHRPLRLGTRVDLVLNFDQPARQLKLRSSVIWEYTLDDGKQPRGYGLGLADLRTEERAFLDEYLRAHRAAAPPSSSQ
ncbi:PilZ domain-containing protein [Melittangium boletus]|uniref:PilZ domain-containing protein n=1 Tax=Melittangium boletus TaxID=83453 RepID=UPI003DA6417C